MNINNKAIEFATFIKNTDEYKNLQKCKYELDKNRNLKRQLDTYINKKNNIYSNNKIEDASKKIATLNNEYNDFFNYPLVSKYMIASKNFNSMMENLYKLIEKELLNK